MNCPVCGKGMERGTLCTEGGVGLYFVPKSSRYESLFITKRGVEACGGVVLDGIYQVRFNKTRKDAWLCHCCRKAVVEY